MRKLLLIPALLLLAFSVYTVVQPFCGPFTMSAPITLNGVSNQTITGLQITCGTGNGIHLINCTNIHITKCRIINGTTINGIGIYATGCTNITVDSTAFENVTAGAQFQNDVTVKFNANEGHNMNGIHSGMTAFYQRGQLVQFNNVSGAGSEIKNNKNFNEFYDTSLATSPEDHISLYKSNGTSGSHIIVSGNWLKGGGPSTTGSGITVGDNGGSYQDITNNILVQTGNIGMQVAGGTFITMSNNTVYSSGTVISHLGIGCGNFTPAFPMSNITISNNRVKWTSAKPSDLAFYPPGTDSIRKDYSYAVAGPYATPQPTGWATNISDNLLTANILSVPLLTVCGAAPIISYGGTSFGFTYGVAVSLVPVNTGGSVTSASVSPALPAGLTLNTTTGAITGTPTNVAVSASYTVTLTNASGSDPVTLTLVVNKAPLIISAISTRKVSGSVNPGLMYVYSGLVLSDTGTSTPATISTTAVTGSPVGLYPITVCCAADSHYLITYVPGVLAVYGQVIIYKAVKIIQRN